jgi:hypothetical protein
MFIGAGRTWMLAPGSLTFMLRRLIAVTAMLGAIALGGASIAAMEPAVTGPAAVLDTAVRGEQVQVNPPPPPPATPTARYRVTLNVNWTSATHPGTLPGNAHLSAPVLAVHGAPGAMFTVGGASSPGIEAMAERGSTGTLVAELNANDQVISVRTGAGVPAPAVGTRTFDVTVLQLDHRISLVSMLAPSPDWFVGFDLATFVDNQWIGSVTMPLGNYDAGTDSGSGFTSGNADTNPAQNISGPRDGSFAAAVGEGAFGTVTITKIG